MIDFLDLHTHKSAHLTGITSIQSLSLTVDVFLAMPKKKPISIGLHPWYATLEKLDLQMKYLNVLARQENVKMIGECGLDRLKGERLEDQLKILERQISLAEELKKPLILHCVRCFRELMDVKEKLKIKVPMIIHGFNKNEELGVRLLNKGFWLSFGPSILNQGSTIEKLIEKTERFFLETDDSDVPIQELYQAVANFKKCSVEALKARIFADYKKLNLR